MDSGPTAELVLKFRTDRVWGRCDHAILCKLRHDCSLARQSPVKWVILSPRTIRVDRNRSFHGCSKSLKRLKTFFILYSMITVTDLIYKNNKGHRHRRPLKQAAPKLVPKLIDVNSTIRESSPSDAHGCYALVGEFS
jgi:hypothetical protein